MRQHWLNKQPAALQRWCFTAHKKAVITALTQEMAGSRRKSKDKKDVHKRVDMTNPFRTDQFQRQLVNFATGIIANANVVIRLTNANDLVNSAVKNIRVQYSIYLLIKRPDSQLPVFMKVVNHVVIHQRNLSLQMLGMSRVKKNQQKKSNYLLL